MVQRLQIQRVGNPTSIGRKLGFFVFILSSLFYQIEAILFKEQWFVKFPYLQTKLLNI